MFFQIVDKGKQLQTAFLLTSASVFCFVFNISLRKMWQNVLATFVMKYLRDELTWNSRDLAYLKKRSSSVTQNPAWLLRTKFYM